MPDDDGDGEKNEAIQESDPVSAESRPMVLDDLSEEVLAAILAQLDCVDLYSTVRRVCRKWRRVAADRHAIGMSPCVARCARRLISDATRAHVNVEQWDDVDKFIGQQTWQTSIKDGVRYLVARQSAGTASNASSLQSVESKQRNRKSDEWLLYAHVDKCPRWRMACRDAVVEGRSDVLDTLIQAKYAVNAKALCAVAARGGHIDVLKLLVRKKITLHAVTCAEAAGGGHLGIIKYARRQGCHWDADACSNAASGGRIECLRYLHENGCPWDERTCAMAAAGGHLACLQYAREFGCPWDDQTTTCAAAGNHVACFDWACERDCPTDYATFDAAARSGNMHMVRYLHAHGCKCFSSAASQAALGGHLEVLQFLDDNGCLLARNICDQAAQGGNLAVLKYVYSRRSEYVNAKTCRKARAGGHRECLRFLLEHGCERDVPAGVDGEDWGPSACLLS